MAYEGDARALRRDSLPGDEAGDGELLPGPVHAVGARGDGAPLGGGTPPGAGAAVSGNRRADGRLDDDRDARGALAASRRGRLSLGARSRDVLKVAVPVKGRLREPSFHLFEDAGLGPEQPGDRALAFPCRNAPVEVLLVRASDVPEYVQDGVVDCGITGIDLVRERRANVLEVLPLGFGSCRLEAAVPEESPVRELADLAGAAVATVYPHLTAELLPVDVTLVDVSGSVGITPRLGLADPMLDLVSSGHTLRTNGLRSIAVLLESEAVLVARDEERAAPFAGMLRAVVEARRHRYLMLNAPESALGAIGELVRPRLPSVLPLAEAGVGARPRPRPAPRGWRLARVNNYPAGGYRALRRAIADYAGVEPENVVLGAGADDLILLCARAYAGPGDTIAIPEGPTYPLFRIAAQLAGAQVTDCYLDT